MVKKIIKDYSDSIKGYNTSKAKTRKLSQKIVTDLRSTFRFIPETEETKKEDLVTRADTNLPLLELKSKSEESDERISFDKDNEKVFPKKMYPFRISVLRQMHKQKDISKKLGVTSRQVYNYEHGVDEPSEDIRFKIDRLFEKANKDYIIASNIEIKVVGKHEKDETTDAHYREFNVGSKKIKQADETEEYAMSHLEKLGEKYQGYYKFIPKFFYNFKIKMQQRKLPTAV